MISWANKKNQTPEKEEEAQQERNHGRSHVVAAGCPGTHGKIVNTL
jgi:hypothetical protein